MYVVGYIQTDTLHLYYQGLQSKTPDTTEAKIAAWAKKLKGKHVDVHVLTYYEKSEFKKYSQERSDEMFLILNRQARDLITIVSNSPVKGAKSQRSTVDVVYTSVGSTGQISQASVTKGDPKKDNSNSAAAKGKSNSADNNNLVINSASNNTKDEFIIDSTYVNGALKVTKKKNKAYIAPNDGGNKKEAGNKKDDGGKSEVNKNEGYVMDSTYVNGKLKITKRKIKQ